MVRRWGTISQLNTAEYVWILSMFGVLAMLEHDRIGLFLIPPFGATLTILIDFPEAPVAQPYALVVGSVVGVSIGTLLSLIARGASWPSSPLSLPSQSLISSMLIIRRV
jgi:CBS domain-containing membrane protein